MQEEGPRAVILDPAARQMGFAFFQEPNGKIWWVLNMGVGGSDEIPVAVELTPETPPTAG